MAIGLGFTVIAFAIRKRPYQDNTFNMTHSGTAPFTNPAQTWNERFAKDGFAFGTQPNEWLKRNAAIWKPGSRVLGVADGEGRNSVWLSKQGHHVDAFDISEVGVRR